VRIATDPKASLELRGRMNVEPAQYVMPKGKPLKSRGTSKLPLVPPKAVIEIVPTTTSEAVTPRTRLLETAIPTRPSVAPVVHRSFRRAQGHEVRLAQTEAALAPQPISVGAGILVHSPGTFGLIVCELYVVKLVRLIWKANRTAPWRRRHCQLLTRRGCRPFNTPREKGLKARFLVQNRYKILCRPRKHPPHNRPFDAAGRIRQLSPH
jgi:hypothetical protein